MKKLIVAIAALGFMATAALAGNGTGAQPSPEFAARHNCEFVAPYDPANPKKITFRCEDKQVSMGGGHVGFCDKAKNTNSKECSSCNRKS